MVYSLHQLVLHKLNLSSGKSVSHLMLSFLKTGAQRESRPIWGTALCWSLLWELFWKGWSQRWTNKAPVTWSMRFWPRMVLLATWVISTARTGRSRSGRTFVWRKPRSCLIMAGFPTWCLRILMMFLSERQQRGTTYRHRSRKDSRPIWHTSMQDDVPKLASNLNSPFLSRFWI